MTDLDPAANVALASVRPPSRRAFLAGIPVAALALAACSSGSSSGSDSSSKSTATAPTTAAPAAAGSVAALAQAFQATLSADQQTTLVHGYTLANAELWSNLPQSLLSRGSGGTGGTPTGSLPSGSNGSLPTGALPSGGPGASGSGPTGAAGPRLGISLTALNDMQLAAFDSLLKAATGSGDGIGYAEIQQHLNADDYLSANGGGSEYGRANFYISFLGTPADSGTWEFQFGGHHLAVANTYKDGELVGATPSFRGIEPNGQFTENGVTNEPLKVKEAALTALLAGLSSTELAQAKLSDVFSDLVLGAGKDWAFPSEHQGVKGSDLNATTKALITTAIASYVNDVADADAKRIMTQYTAEIDDTYVAYSGTTGLTEFDDYIRIDGPSVWIEFSMQHGIVLSGNHPHSVWRDRNTDYGGTKK